MHECDWLIVAHSFLVLFCFSLPPPPRLLLHPLSLAPSLSQDHKNAMDSDVSTIQARTNTDERAGLEEVTEGMKKNGVVKTGADVRFRKVGGGLRVGAAAKVVAAATVEVAKTAAQTGYEACMSAVGLKRGKSFCAGWLE